MDDGWPHSWRSLSWLPLLVSLPVTALRWVWRETTTHLLHETDRMRR